MRAHLLLIFSFFIFLPGIAEATIYKCRGDSGVTVFRSYLCQSNENLIETIVYHDLQLERQRQRIRLQIERKRQRREWLESLSPIDRLLHEMEEQKREEKKTTKKKREKEWLSIEPIKNKKSKKTRHTPIGTFRCGRKSRCGQMVSCDEAYFYLNTCHVRKLDRDRDGIPCETICR